MKLYATVESERASKGQGGNKQVRVQFLYEDENGERQSAGTVEMRVDFDTISIVSSVPKYESYKTKAKRQKGDKVLGSCFNSPCNC